MYKVKSSDPCSVAEIFKVKETRYSLRNSDFDIPKFNTVNYRKHSLRYSGPILWTKLSADIKNSANLEIFKKKIRKTDIVNLLDNNCNCCDFCSTRLLTG